jgi:hypothetical protein
MQCGISVVRVNETVYVGQIMYRFCEGLRLQLICELLKLVKNKVIYSTHLLGDLLFDFRVKCHNQEEFQHLSPVK